jgi:AcrR family transcriptional regulator
MERDMESTRRYVQRARAEATAHTRERILEATVALAEERLSLEIVLGDVARRAGVSVQTVLRHFGSREGLFDAARRHQLEQVRAERAVPAGDVAAAVAAVVDFYERAGDWSVQMLAQEHVEHDVATVVADGRTLHRDWVREVFGPFLAGTPDPEELTDLLVIATDVYTWKLLRRDAGHDQGVTGQRMLHLVRALLPAPEHGR